MSSVPTVPVVLPDISKHEIKNYEIHQNRGQLCATSLLLQRPGRGSEVFLTNLARDLLLQELYKFMNQCGKIYEIRLLMDFSGYNRGFGYVKYCSSRSARLAVISLTGKQIKPGYRVKIKLSFDNNQLLMRGIPNYIRVHHVQEIIRDLVSDGLTDVKVFNSNYGSRSGGGLKSYIVTYDTHRQALEARKKLWPGLEIGNKRVDIDWAFPAEIGNAQYLYCKNIPEDVTALDLFEVLTKLLDVEQILDVHVHKGYGFVLVANSFILFEAMKILRANTVWGIKLELDTKRFPEASFPDMDFNNGCEFQHSSSNTVVESQPPLLSQHFESVGDEYQIVPTQVLTPPPVYTELGFLNELTAVETALYGVINFQHPLFKWIYMMPDEMPPAEAINVVLTRPTVNDVTYEFQLVLVPRY